MMRSFYFMPMDKSPNNGEKVNVSFSLHEMLNDFKKCFGCFMPEFGEMDKIYCKGEVKLRDDLNFF